jgi:hypothetical protein
MPGFSVNALKSNISSLARGYLFNCVFNFAPVPIMGGENKTAYLVRSTSLPESVIEPLVIPWQGMEAKYAQTHTYAEWECAFNVDGDADIIKNMQLWSRLIHDPATNLHGSPSLYQGEVMLELLNGSGNAIVTYMLHDVWPSTVGSIDLAQDNKDVAQLSVTFTYHYYDVI